MAIRNNAPLNLFVVKSPRLDYPVLEGISVVKGELLYFHEIDGITYVTNKVTYDNPANAIAIRSGDSLEVIPCYVLERR